MNFIETPAPETNAPELINKNGFGLALHAGESERPAQVPTRPPGESRLGQSGGASTIGFLVRSLCSPSIGFPIQDVPGRRSQRNRRRPPHAVEIEPCLQ
jgi:hypothetical protein